MSLEAFHFLRPAWLGALIPLALLALRLRRAREGSPWRKVVAPELAPHVIEPGDGSGFRWGWLLVFLGFSLAILAAAGPTWEKQPMPALRGGTPLVVVLDLSRSMDAQDLEPSRLEQARFKIRDLLAARREGETALVVFAGAPFVVVPLTEDTETIALQVPVLTTDLMPVQGSDAAAAVDRAVALLRGAGHERGRILLVTDGGEAVQAKAAAASARAAGFHVSVLGVGTPGGAPVPTRAGLLRDADGNLVVARLDEGALAAVARAGGGRYARIAPDDGDLRRLDLLDRKEEWIADGKEKDHVVRWRDVGPWLLPPVLLLAALAFRRGVLGAVLIAALLPHPRSAVADWWQDLWRRPDQQGAALLERGRAAEAAERFEDRRWRATALYRAGDYAGAARLWAEGTDAEDQYNLGNALARQGRLQDALKAYDRALDLAPDHADAKANRALVRKLLERHRRPSRKEERNGGERPSGGEGRSGAHAPDASSSKLEGRQGEEKGDEARDAHGEERKDAAAQRSGERAGDGTMEKEDRTEPGGRPAASASVTPAAPHGEQAAGARSDQNDVGSEDRADSEEAARRREAQNALGRALKQEVDRSLAREASGPVSAEGGTRRERDGPMNEQALAREQWLRRIEDDPGELLRRKFRHYYRRIPHETVSRDPW